MAKFRINLLTPYIEDTTKKLKTVVEGSENITNESVQYYRELITDFELNNNVYNYTFDEQITINKNAQEQLSFKMFKDIRNNDMTINNPFFTKIKNGSLIEVIDKYKFPHWFVINKIDYKIKKYTVEINYGATDYFNNQLSKRETSYTIKNDPSTTGFIGAKNLQYWIDKICNECKISYSYIPLEYEIYATNEGQYIAKLNNNYYNLDDLQTPIENMRISDLRQLMRKNLADIDRPITYSLSGSSAANAIINLGEQYGLNVSVDYRTKTFWYKEIKNSTYTGLKYSPNINLQSLSVGQQTNNLTTIFNVEGPEIAGEKISLLEAPTPLFLEWFSKPGSGWDDSIYYPGLYTDYVLTRGGSAADLHFAKLAEKVPLLENKIFKSAYIQKVYNPSLYYQIENQIYNKLRINNGKLLCCRNILAQLTKEKAEFTGKYLEPACDTQGTLLYNHRFHEGEAPTDATFSDLPNFNTIKLDEVITYYGNLYRESLQTFAKNLYALRDYWDNNLKNSWPANNPTEMYQLTQYWNNMYLAALKCDYAVQKELPTDLDLTAALNNLPVITINEDNNYKIYTYYESEETETPEDWMSTFCNNIDLYNTGYWHTTLVPDRKQVYYIINGLNDSTDTKSRWKDRLNIEYRQGWYQNFIKGYLSHCNDQFKSIYTQYSELVKTNQNIWADLYKNYGMLLLESSFTSSTATSSEELYNEAMTYYAEYENPEKTYNLTIIDTSFIKDYIPIIITVGDQIALDYNEFYQEEDDLKDLLQEHLFISSIQYSLRKDSDIQYNVVTTSFYDKLFNKLVNLIK